jgi:hypothetical protein
MVELKDEESTTLMSDETRKQGDVYEIFAVRDQTGKNWVLGLKKWLTSHHSHVWTQCFSDAALSDIVFFYIAKYMLSKFSCRRSVDIINNKF